MAAAAQSQAAHDGDQAQPDVPMQVALHDQGMHAEEVHGGDAGTYDQATADGVMRPAARQPKSQPSSQPLR